MSKGSSIYVVLGIIFLNISITRAARVVLALYALELGAQPFTVGILAATFSLLPMLLALPTGKLADRFGARWLLMFATSMGTLGMLVTHFSPGLFTIFIAAAMMGFSEGTYVILGQNLVGLLSTPEVRARNFASFTMVGSLTSLAGPLIGGFSIDQSGHAAACLYLALLTLMPIGMLAIRGGVFRGGTRPATPSRGGLRVMLSEPGVRRVLVTTSLMVTGVEMYRFYMPVYMHAIEMSASNIGIVLAMNAAAEFGVRFILPGLVARFTPQRVLACAFYVGAASLMLVPLFNSVVALGLISFMFGLGMGCGQPVTLMLMFSNSVEGRSGEALGLRMTVNHSTRLVAPTVFGAIGSAFGLFPVFWISAVMMCVGGIFSRKGKAGGIVRKTET